MSTIDFQQRFDSLGVVLRSFAYTLTNNFEESKDLYQETAFRAYKNIEKFQPDTNFKAWLMTIMKNIFINDYRRKSKANTIFDHTENQYYLNSGKVTVRNDGDANILMKELKHLIEGLEDGIRIPFQMHYQGYKYQEIADHFELPLGTVKSRIFFARRELKDKIKRRYGNIER